MLGVQQLGQHDRAVRIGPVAVGGDGRRVPAAAFGDNPAVPVQRAGQIHIFFFPFNP